MRMLVTSIFGKVVGAFDRAYRERADKSVDPVFSMDKMTLELVTEVFTEIDPNKQCQSVLDSQPGTHATWVGTFQLADAECSAEIARTWRYGRYLDSEIAALLNEVESSNFWRILRLMGSNHIMNPNLSNLAQPYLDLFKSAQHLARFESELRARYVSVKAAQLVT